MSNIKKGNWRRSIWQLGLASLVAADLGCTKTDAPTNAAQSAQNPASTWVKIRSITPDESRPLTPGTLVNFAVIVDYQLSSGPGAIGLILETGSSEVLGNSARVVPKGVGTVKLKKSITIPRRVSTIEVFTSLFVQGEAQSRVADLKFYKVQQS
jgi:hypothetical protein